MSDNDNRLYWYEEARELVITRDSIYVDNRPMNNRNLKAHRGLTNEILFNVRDRDRKLQNMFAYDLYANLIDPNNKKRMLTRKLEHTTDLGKAKLVLNEGDLANITPGRYHIYIARKNNDSESLALYKDQDNNVRFDIEITDQVGLEPIETTHIEQEEFNVVKSIAQDGEIVITSPPMSGNLCRNFTNAQHTLLVKLVEDRPFAGIITIQASCLESTPDQSDESTDWFDVYTWDKTDSTVNDPLTLVHSFQANCNWVRIVVAFDLDGPTITQGGIDFVQLRN